MIFASTETVNAAPVRCDDWLEPVGLERRVGSGESPVRSGVGGVLTHLDLFSGIGGFALAARWAGFETVAMCEREPYCRSVLRRHWPDVPICEDIHELQGRDYYEPTLLTGGFPCQPYSEAGKQMGAADDRDLWPQMLRVIEESRPCWVVGENSPEVLKMVFAKIKAGMEGVGYEVGEPLVIPACAVGTDHVRERAWILAHADDERMQARRPEGNVRSAAVAARRLVRQHIHSASLTDFRVRRATRRSSSGVPRMDDGLPHRVDRNHALGNAIVPQVAFEILRGIAAIHAGGGGAEQVGETGADGRTPKGSNIVLSNGGEA